MNIKFFKRLFLVGFLLTSQGVLAAKGDGKLGVYTRLASETQDESIKTVMITVFNEETAIAQREVSISSYSSFSNLQPGNYNVRFEGPKLKTVEKRGILIFTNQTTEIKTFIEVGDGDSVIEYSTQN